MICSKSFLVESIFFDGLAWDFPVVTPDFTKEDESSTFSDYTEFMAERGGYFDISKQDTNLFEIPDLQKLSLETQTFLAFLEYQGDSFIRKTSTKKLWTTNQIFG